MTEYTDYPAESKLEVRHLSCRRNERILFEAVNLCLSPNQVLFLEGENGSGKTSLLRIMCGFRLQDEGEIFWDGQPITDIPDYFQNITYVGHKNGIKDELTVAENLNLMHSAVPPSVIDKETILKQIGLFKYSDVIIRHLSAGQKRKLALARLLISDGALWILDEPFTSLDKSSVGFFEDVIKKYILRGGMIILTSHHHIDLGGLTVKKINLTN